MRRSFRYIFVKVYYGTVTETKDFLAISYPLCYLDLGRRWYFHVSLGGLQRVSGNVHR